MHTGYFLTNSAIAVAVLLYVYFGPFLRLRRDDFRSDIRRLRDELFDYMWQHGYSYENRAYQDTRQLLNGALRASNKVRLTRIVVAWMVPCGDKEPSLFAGFKDCPPALREKLLETTAAVLVRSLRYFFAEGIVGLAFRWIVIPALAVTASWRTIPKQAASAGAVSIETDTASIEKIESAELNQKVMAQSPKPTVSPILAARFLSRLGRPGSELSGIDRHYLRTA